MAQKTKKILIVSLATGSGHVQAARALTQAARLDFPNLECLHIDIADYITPLLKKATVSGYGFLVEHLPKVWASLFYLSDNQTFIKAYRSLTDYLKMLNSFEFLNKVYSFEPDHIISTHFLPSEILLHSMKKRKKHIPITEILTDYGVHPVLLVKGIDSYIVSTKDMKHELVNHFGIKPTMVHTFGIPIDPQFFEKKDVASIESRYKLAPHIPRVLILSGGSGMIEISEIVTELFSSFKKPLAIFAVSGHNKKLYQRLKALKPPPHIAYTPLGWTDEISDLMRIATVVISKPGGLTTTECMVSRVPMIAINPIPGQEEYNIEFLEKNHLGSHAKTAAEILPLLEFYLSGNYHKKDRAFAQSSTEILNFISSQ